MIKSLEIGKKSRGEVFNLRYFRIIFKSRKLVIKVNKEDKKMRSLNLAHLISAEASDSTTIDGKVNAPKLIE